LKWLLKSMCRLSSLSLPAAQKNTRLTLSQGIAERLR
jgi:hypothetical protein